MKVSTRFRRGIAFLIGLRGAGDHQVSILVPHVDRCRWGIPNMIIIVYWRSHSNLEAYWTSSIEATMIQDVLPSHIHAGDKPSKCRSPMATISPWYASPQPIETSILIRRSGVHKKAEIAMVLVLSWRHQSPR